MTADPVVIETMYWMKDRSWFTFDPHQGIEYHLTDIAPERAKKAYEKWLEIQRKTT